jgi:SMODS and SLOG-associating 2TM effector domain 6
MKKNDLLKHIAETSYNVGFGAKKHFATYDIVDKTPGLISFISTAIGIFALFIDALSVKSLSATFIVLGITGLYISFYDSKKQEYASVGTQLTQIFNELKHLYYQVKGVQPDELENLQRKLCDIENKYYQICISKQILFSDWYAHYKFFWQHQIDWIDEQLNFSLFRDEIPLSLSVSILILIFIGSCLMGEIWKLCLNF